MNINGLSPKIIELLGNEPSLSKSAGVADSVGTSFADILTESLKDAAKADSADKISGLELLIGENNDLAGLILDAQKAEISLNLALQIRNKVLDAYNEIMRMQV